MMRPFDKSSLVYNLMYKDKDYAKEAKYIDEVIRKYNPSSKTILDLGCGTGQHARFLAKKGYRVHGIDLSKTMIAEAEKLISDNNLTFSVGDIRTIRIKESFDTVISLFHVISYQTSNDDLQRTFSTVFNHLKQEGLFIFDCWYGPAVLTEQPAAKLKIVEDNRYKNIRFTEPVVHPNENIVEVNFDYFVLDNKNNTMEEFKETHLMRYLFKPELELLLGNAGFKLIEAFEFLTNKELGSNSWNACFIAVKQ